MSNFYKERVLFAICFIALLSCILISYRIWFPVSNLFPALPVLPIQYSNSVNVIAAILFVISLCLLAVPAISARKKNLALAFLVIYALGDYNRIQPWFYYFLIFIGITINVKDQKKVRLTFGFIISCIYFMSGLLKFNGGFASSTIIWFITPLKPLLNDNLFALFTERLWFSAPILELSAALGLLFKKTVRISAFVLIVMHIFILGVVGPLGWNTNFVIWPWNIGFMVMLYVLFIHNPIFIASQLTNNIGRATSFLLFLLFILLPISSIWNVWPMHFSGALYSGNKIKSEILIPDEFANKLQVVYQPPHNGIEYIIQPNSWAIQELQVAMYPSERAHQMLYRGICNKYSRYADYFVFTTKPVLSHFSGNRDSISYFCSDFMN